MVEFQKRVWTERADRLLHRRLGPPEEMAIATAAMAASSASRATAADVDRRAQLRSMSVAFGGVTALDGVDLDVGRA